MNSNKFWEAAEYFLKEGWMDPKAQLPVEETPEQQKALELWELEKLINKYPSEARDIVEALDEDVTPWDDRDDFTRINERLEDDLELQSDSERGH